MEDNAVTHPVLSDMTRMQWVSNWETVAEIIDISLVEAYEQLILLFYVL